MTEGEETLADVDHTHPHTDETFGGVYRRGPVVADGAGDGSGHGPGVGVHDAADECLGELNHASDCPETAAGELWKRGPGDVPDVPDVSGARAARDPEDDR